MSEGKLKDVYVPYKDLKGANFVFGERFTPKDKNGKPKGQDMATVSYKDGEKTARPIVKSTIMNLRFGLGSDESWKLKQAKEEYENGKTKVPPPTGYPLEELKFELSPSFFGMKGSKYGESKEGTNEKLLAMFEKCKEIDAAAIDAAVKNYKSWFPDLKNETDMKFVRKAIERGYIPIIKWPKVKGSKTEIDPNYAPKLKFKVYLNKNFDKDKALSDPTESQYSVECFRREPLLDETGRQVVDEKGNLKFKSVPSSVEKEIPAGVNADGMFSFCPSKVYFMTGGVWGLTLNAKQVLVTQTYVYSGGKTGKSHFNDADVEGEHSESAGGNAGDSDGKNGILGSEALEKVLASLSEPDDDEDGDNQGSEETSEDSTPVVKKSAGTKSAAVSVKKPGATAKKSADGEKKAGTVKKIIKKKVATK